MKLLRLLPLLLFAPLPVLRAQETGDDAPPPPLPRLGLPAPGAFDGVAFGWSFARPPDDAAARAPWGDRRGPLANARWSAGDGSLLLETRVTGRGPRAFELRSQFRGGARLEVDYRRVRRSVQDDAPALLTAAGMDPALAAIYARTAADPFDPDGRWDESGVPALAPHARTARIGTRRDILGASLTMPAGERGEVFVTLDVQRRRGNRIASYLVATGLQPFPGPDTVPFGEPKAFLPFLLPVDEDDQALAAGYRLRGSRLRLSASAGVSRHEDGVTRLRADNPWPGVPDLDARPGQATNRRFAEIKLAPRLGSGTLSAEFKFDEGRADLSFDGLTPYAPAPPPAMAGTRAKSRRQALALAWRGAGGAWDWSVEARRRRRQRVDAPVGLPGYEHPLAGAELGFTLPGAPVPGLARTPRPMNFRRDEAQAGIGRQIGVTGTRLEATAGAYKETRAWRAVPEVRGTTAGFSLAAGGPRGRVRLALEGERRRADAPIADYYETVFLGPDGLLFGEPGQAVGFVPADLRAGRRVRASASADRELSPRWQLTGDGAWERFTPARAARAGGGAERRASAGFALTALFPRWSWRLAADGGRERAELSASKQGPGGAVDPLHDDPLAFSSRSSHWGASQRVEWAPAAPWRLSLDANLGGWDADPALGSALALRTSGARLALEWRPPAAEWGFGFAADLRSVRRRDAGDAIPTIAAGTRNDPYSGLPAGDLYAPRPAIGPDGWSAEVRVNWHPR